MVRRQAMICLMSAYYHYLNDTLVVWEQEVGWELVVTHVFVEVVERVGNRGTQWRSAQDFMKQKCNTQLWPKKDGIDKNDAMIGNYQCIRKHKSGTLKFIIISQRRVFSIHLLSSRKMILMREKGMWFGKWSKESMKKSNTTTLFDGLKGRHFPILILPTENKEKPQKRCVVCSKRNGRKR